MLNNCIIIFILCFCSTFFLFIYRCCYFWFLPRWRLCWKHIGVTKQKRFSFFREDLFDFWECRRSFEFYFNEIKNQIKNLSAQKNAASSFQSTLFFVFALTSVSYVIKLQKRLHERNRRTDRQTKIFSTTDLVILFILINRLISVQFPNSNEFTDQTCLM